MNRLTAALAAATLAVGLLVGAAGAALVGAGTNNGADIQAQMYRMMGGQYGRAGMMGGQYGGGMMGGAGMMGGQYGGGMMGGEYGPGMMGPWASQSPEP